MKNNLKQIINIFENQTQINVLSTHKTRKGNSSITYKIITNQGDYYFKQGKGNYQIQYEISKKLNLLHVKYPEIVSFSSDWIIEKRVDGLNLDIRKEKLTERILVNFGEQLGLIHSIKTCGFGELQKNLQGEFEDYISYYEKVLPFIPSRYLNRVNIYLNKKHDTRLNHGDVAPNHIYIKNKEFISLIDWDDVVSAPREFDLSELLLNLDWNEKFWNSLILGYSKHFPKIDIKDEDLVTAGLLQAYESYYWYISEKKDNLKLLDSINKSISKVERIINE